MSGGQVVAAFGRNFLVETDGGEIAHCLVRGKTAEVACGDRVHLSGNVIEAVDPRSSLFYRSVTFRRKLLAANVTQAAILVAVEPSFSDELVLRASVATCAAGMRAVIVLNKIDLPRVEAARARLEPFTAGGFRVVEISAKCDVTPFAPLLAGETTVFVGQSGMGKSTLLNHLVPEAQAATRDISRFLASGRHTTSASRLYRLAPDTALIDTPGMQEFGIAHLERRDIEAAIPAFRPLLGRCRFADCRHVSEPGCALRSGAEEGRIPARLFELFQRLAAVSP